jgi:hypothetical protein
MSTFGRMQTNQGPAGPGKSSGEVTRRIRTGAELDGGGGADGQRAGGPGIGGNRAGGGAVRRGFGVLMLIEAATLAVAAILHLGAHIPLGFLTVRGTHQSDAAFPELLIAAVLAAGSVAVFRFPDRARWAALAATWFAVAGVILGLSITASGDGPAKAPNVAYHVCLLAVLVTGLLALLRDTPRPR